MKKLLLVFLLAGLVAFGWTLGPRVLEEYGDEPGIHVLREGDVPDAVEADVQKGVAGFAALMEEQGIGTAGGLSHGVKVFAAAGVMRADSPLNVREPAGKKARGWPAFSSASIVFTAERSEAPLTRLIGER